MLTKTIDVKRWGRRRELSVVRTWRLLGMPFYWQRAPFY